MRTLLVAVLGFSVLQAPAHAVAAPALCARSDVVHIRPGQDAPRRVAAAPRGATVCFAPGFYRLTRAIEPRYGQSLIGQRSTLDGSRRLASFRRVADGWRAEGQTQDGERTGECTSGTVCTYPNDILSDGRPLHRVLRRSRLRSGRYWFDYRHHAVVVDVNPRRHRLTALVAPAAITSRGPRHGADVEVRGFTVQHFASPAQHGAIFTSAPGWTITHTVVRDNHGAGVTTEGHVRVRHDVISNNGQLGIGGTGTDTSVETTTISHNGYGGYDTGWEAGGGKWAVTNGLRVEQDRVLDNRGPGLWTDIDAEHSTFTHDVVSGNTAAGIFIEISTSTNITHNTVRKNGRGQHVWLWGGGIQLAASHNITVADNRLAGNRTGISLIQQDRGTSERDGKPRTLHDITIRNNLVHMSHGDSGGVTDDGYERMFTDPSITWSDDTWIGSKTASFDWNNTYLSAKQWRALGHDVHGHFR